MLRRSIIVACLITLSISTAAESYADAPIHLGPRPFFLVDQVDDTSLKKKLESCSAGPFKPSLWSIGHRGAPLQFPEHTAQSYRAAARMGAGIIECDVTFTKDKELVCRHAQNDLHTTTNILATPLAAQCTKPFKPASGDQPATVECRASDVTLAQFKSLTGKMDAGNPNAKSVGDYMNATADWRTDLYSGGGTVMTHRESIKLIKSLGRKFTPELKSPSVAMPYDGFSQADYAQKLIDEYKAENIDPADVWPQSFNLDDVLYWIKEESEFGKQAVFLDASYRIDGWSPENEKTWPNSMEELKAKGVNYIAPPLWVLIKLENGKMVPSTYAIKAREAGLKVITWTVERSGLIKNGGGWYFQTVSDAINDEGDVMKVMNVLHKDVGIVGLFSDWPATTTYYANCFGLK